MSMCSNLAYKAVALLFFVFTACALDADNGAGPIRGSNSGNHRVCTPYTLSSSCTTPQYPQGKASAVFAR